MLTGLKRSLARRRLKDQRFAFLFEPPPDEDLVSVDCETTGLDVASAEILSIAAVRIRGSRILTSEPLELIVRSPIAATKETVLIHHLRSVDTARGMDRDEAIERFLQFAGARPLVGYFLSFDVAMLNKYIRPRLGVSLVNRRIEVSELYHDAKTRLLPNRHVDLSLRAICADLDLPTFAAHDPFNDALTAAMMYLRLTGPRRFLSGT